MDPDAVRAWDAAHLLRPDAEQTKAASFVMREISGLSVPDDANLVTWRVDVGDFSAPMVCKEAGSRASYTFYHLDSKPAVLAPIAAGVPVRVAIVANGSDELLSGTLTPTDKHDYMGGPCYIVPIEDSLLVVHIMNVKGVGVCAVQVRFVTKL